MVPTTANNDAALVKATLSGDRDAFGQIVARYQALICTLTYNATGNIDQSQDLAQETFVTAWKQLATLREPEKLRSWLCAIARNLTKNFFRRQKREPVHAAEPIENIAETHSPEPLPLEQTITKEEQAILWRSLEKIPDTYREPLVLFYRENQSVEAVAEKLELTPEAVHQRLSRGRKLLSEEVTTFVEAALARTNPGKTFTIAVVAALPAMTLPAKAATLSTAAKAGAAAQITAFLAIAGAILTPLLALFGMWTDYHAKQRAGESPQVLRALKIRYITVFFTITAMVAASWVLMSGGHPIMKSHPTLFGVLVAGWILTCVGTIAVMSIRDAKAAKRFAAKQKQAGIAEQSPTALWEYRSRFELLGLPFLHIRFWGWHGRRLEEQAKIRKPLKAWIAISDTVSIGVLFAWGATAIAPIALGLCAFGFLSLAGVSVGVLSFGGFTFGIWAVAPFAFGWQACGDYAVAWHTACGGRYALAHYYALAETARAAQANTDSVRTMILANPFFQFCKNHISFTIGVFLTWAGMLPIIISNIARARLTRSSK